MTLLSCENMTIGYDNQPVLRHLSFSVDEGDYVSILGENGSGKSTLVKTILGLTRPLSGDFSFAGQLSRKRIGYLPQQTTSQRDFPASVLEIVLSGFLGKMGWRPFYGRREKEAALAYMDELGIKPLADKYYRNLSGGQQQRVLLARALCATGNLLILDEPVTGLDPSAQAELYQLITDINKRRRITILMISHDIAAAMRYSSKILHLGEDSYFYGSVAKYKNSRLYREQKGE